MTDASTVNSAFPEGPARNTIVLASLNVHGLKAGWRSRAPLIIKESARISPDVVVLQEAARWAPQARWIAWKLGRALPGSRYRVLSAAKRDWWWFVEGLAVLTRLPVLDDSALDLRGDSRIAQRVTMRAAGGAEFDLYNVHLPHRGEDEALRVAQVERLLRWADTRHGVPALFAGDYNAAPDAPSVQAMLARFRSVHVAAHGGEPPFTAPSNPGPGGGRAIDYVFADERFHVLDCEVAFAAVEVRGRAVFPSDHLGLAVTLRLGED